MHHGKTAAAGFCSSLHLSMRRVINMRCSSTCTRLALHLTLIAHLSVEYDLVDVSALIIKLRRAPLVIRSIKGPDLARFGSRSQIVLFLDYVHLGVVV